MADNEKIIIEVVPELQLAPIERKYLEFKDDIKKLKAAIREDLKLEFGIVRPSAKDVNAIANQVIAEAKRIEKEEKLSYAKRIAAHEEFLLKQVKDSDATAKMLLAFEKEQTNRELAELKQRISTKHKWQKDQIANIRAERIAEAKEEERFNKQIATQELSELRQRIATKHTYRQAEIKRIRADREAEAKAEEQLNKRLEASRAKLNIGANNTKVTPSGDFSSIRDKKTYTTGTSSALDFTAQEKEYKRLDKAMRDLDATSKNTFPHKISTTAQYMAAGAMIGGVTTAIYGMVGAIVETNKAVTSFQAILFSNGETTEQAKAKAEALQKSIFDVGSTYGANLKDLEETALSLGRAGVSGNQLAEAMKVVGQASVASGEKMDGITEMFTAWHTVFPEKTFKELGDAITYAANSSLASIGGIKTMTSYVLTSGKAAGLTSNSILTLISSMKDLGVADSIVGTTARRFFEQLENSNIKTKNAYRKLGVDVDEVSKKMKLGPKEAEAAMVSMMGTLSKATKDQVKNAIQGIGTLEASSITAVTELAPKYEKRLKDITLKANGVLEDTAGKMSLSYENFWNRIKNIATEGSSELEKSFRKSFTGGNASIEETQRKMDEFRDSVIGTAQDIGSAIGSISKFLVEHKEALKDIIATYAIYKAMAVSADIYLGIMAIIKGIESATKAQKIFNAVVRANPYVIAGTVIGAAALSIYEFNSALDDQTNAQIKSNGERELSYQLSKLEGKTTKEKTAALLAHSKQLEIATAKEVALAKKAGTTESFSYKSMLGSAQYEQKLIQAEINKLNTLKAKFKETPKPGADPLALIPGKDKKASNEAEQRAKEELRVRIAAIELENERFTSTLTNEDAIQAAKLETLQLVSNIANETKYTQYASLKDDAMKKETDFLKFKGGMLRKEDDLNTKSQAKILIDKAELEVLKAKSEEEKIQAAYGKATADAEAKFLEESKKAGNAKNAENERQAAYDNAETKRKVDLVNLEQNRKFELQNITAELAKQQSQFDAQYASAMAVSDVQANRLAFEAQLVAFSQEKMRLETAFKQEMEKDKVAEGSDYYNQKHAALEKSIALIEKEVELSKELQAMKVGDTLIDNADKLADSFKGMSKGWDKAQKGIQGMAKASQSYMKIQQKSSAMEVKALDDLSTGKITQAEFDEQEAARKQEQFSAELGAYSALASGMAGFFEEGSRGAKAMQAVSATLGIAQGIQAMISAWGSAPFPFNLPAVAATTAAVLPMIGQLTSLGGSGGSGGGVGASTQTTMDTAKYDSQQADFIVDRLDRQIELLESIDRGGTAAKTKVALAGSTFEADLAKMWAELIGTGNRAYSVEGNINITGDSLTDIQSTIGWLNGMKDIFSAADWVWLDMTRGDLLGFQSELEDAVNSFAINLSEVKDSVKDSSEGFKEIYDSLSGTDFYKARDLATAFGELGNSIVGNTKDSMLSYLATAVTEMEKLGKNYLETTKAILVEGSVDQQVAALKELSKAFNQTFNDSTEEALNFLESIGLVAEAISTSNKNMKSFMDGLRTSDQLLANQAASFNVDVASTVEQLVGQVSLLANDLEGLTDAELDFLEKSKDYIIAIEEAKLEEQIKALNTTLSDTADTIGKLKSNSDGLIGIIDSILGKAGGSSYSLTQFYEALDNIKTLDPTKVEFGDEVKRLSANQSALFDTSIFSSGEEMLFAQLSSANALSEVNAGTMTQIDYLAAIEENTALQIKLLEEQLRNVGGTINSQLLSAINSATGDRFEQWAKDRDSGTIQWKSLGGAVATQGASDFTIKAISNTSFTGSEAKGFVASQLQSGNERAVYDAAKATGISANSLDALMGWAAGTSNTWSVLNGLAPFMAGGYTGDMATNAIAGVVHGKEYVVNAQTTKDLGLNNSAGVFAELLTEIRELKQYTISTAASATKSLSTQRAMLGEMTA